MDGAGAGAGTRRRHGRSVPAVYVPVALSAGTDRHCAGHRLRSVPAGARAGQPFSATPVFGSLSDTADRQGPAVRPRAAKRHEIKRFSSLWRWDFPARAGTSRAVAGLWDHSDMNRGTRTAVVAWLVTAVYYFYQYTLRSAPAVMMPQLSAAFGLTAAGAASLAGLFYYGYSPFSLVAGVAMDRLGPRAIVPIGAATVGVGALLFASGNSTAASVGRLLQGAGGVFALVGAAYIATTNFPASRAATLIGATQMFGMAGGSAGQFVVGPLIASGRSSSRLLIGMGGGPPGQFVVGPMIASGVSWSRFWIGMGVAGLVVSALLYALLPAPKRAESRANDDWMKSAARAMGIVFRNPQSILCGVISGL